MDCLKDHYSARKWNRNPVSEPLCFSVSRPHACFTMLAFYESWPRNSTVVARRTLPLYGKSEASFNNRSSARKGQSITEPTPGSWWFAETCFKKTILIPGLSRPQNPIKAINFHCSHSKIESARSPWRKQMFESSVLLCCSSHFPVRELPWGKHGKSARGQQPGGYLPPIVYPGSSWW